MQDLFGGNIPLRLVYPSEYNSWVAMRQRCYSVKHQHYNNYGGRGIRICVRWENSFENFLIDMGPKPNKKYSIHRLDNDKNYEPDNCKWATSKEQSNNRRNSKWYRQLYFLPPYQYPGLKPRKRRKIVEKV
jgi:hypothetical protein